MRYSNNLLKRYISLDVHPDQIASELTLKVCEVEEMHVRILPDEVVIGKITEIKPHPNADKLTVCQLDCGSKGTYQICTGGENVIVDSYVPVALPGCFLPVINLKIDPREMRGEASNGMICSKQELGIPENLEDHRIRTLQYADRTDLSTVPQQPDMDDLTDKDLGIPLGEKYPRLHNRMADVENKTITHRPDLFGHFGLSVELDTLFPGQATFSNGKRYMQQIIQGNIFETLGNATPIKRKIDVKTDLVLAYTLIELNNVQIKRSDFLLRMHLHDLELQPKNNRVDLSNLFMYLTGQPVHFFDAKKVVGDIIVRQAKKGEVFVDLLGKEHQLLEEDIVIADADKILALGGVIGGNSSCIDETTTDILVEIANFDPVTVRKTGTRLALRTDAELRFEKQINPLYSLHTSTMFLDELQYFAKSLGTYTIAGLSRWASSSASTKIVKKIPLDTLVVEHLLFGYNENVGEHKISDHTIATILLSLGCLINEEREVTIPGRRGPADLTQEIDLVEEIARIYGFEAIEPLVYKDQSCFVPFGTAITWNRKIENLLAHDYTYDQIETYPWIDQRWIDIFSLPVSALYTMENPLTPEQRYARDTMLRSMFEVVEKNAPFFDVMKLFDIGKTRQQGRDIPEQEHIGLAYRQKSCDDRSQDGLLHTKGVISAILQTLGIKGKLEYITTNNALYHPKQQATIALNQEQIGTIQTIHPYGVQKTKLSAQGKLVLAEISISTLQLIAASQNSLLAQSYETLQDQVIRRDLNFVVAHATEYGTVSHAVQKIKEIKMVELFDLYAGSRIPEGKKSIGLRVKIVGDGELQTTQINEIIQQAVKTVEAVGGELRK